MFTKEEIYYYIVKNNLSVDLDFVIDYWSKKEWKTKKGEPVKTLAAAVNVCNSIYCTRIRKELQASKHQKRLKENMARYYGNYNDQLNSSEWKAYREFILTVRGYRCDVCGCNHNLQIHHKKYIDGRKAWEYIPNEVLVLCCDCHKRIHGLE